MNFLMSDSLILIVLDSIASLLPPPLLGSRDRGYHGMVGNVIIVSVGIMVVIQVKSTRAAAIECE